MATEVSKDSKFTLSIETGISVLVTVAMVVGMWFTLQADIEEAKELPVPEVGRTEYDLKDQMIRNTIIETQKDVTEMKEEQKEMRDDVKNIERMMMQQKWGIEMNLYYGILWLLGLSLWLTPLHSQGKLKDLTQIQLLSQDECVIVQVNADWNVKASIDLGKMKNCKWFNASIDDKQYGAIIANEWKIKSVPTIIMFEYGKEIKRFEAGLSFNLDSDKIKKEIDEQIDEIMLRRFQWCII